MNAQEFQKIERVFHAALKLEPEERSPFISAELPDEPTLQQEVGELLAAAQRGSTFMETSLLTGPFEPPDIDALVGREIGPYRLVRVLGRGGMGTVYEAEQKWPHRRVALKVIHGAPGADIARWSGHEPKVLGRQADRRFQLSDQTAGRLGVLFRTSGKADGVHQSRGMQDCPRVPAACRFRKIQAGQALIELQGQMSDESGSLAIGISK